MSTNLQRIEDFGENPNNPATFYFNTTSTTPDMSSLLEPHNRGSVGNLQSV